MGEFLQIDDHVSKDSVRKTMGLILILFLIIMLSGDPEFPRLMNVPMLTGDHSVYFLKSRSISWMFTVSTCFYNTLAIP